MIFVLDGDTKKDGEPDRKVRMCIRKIIFFGMRIGDFESRMELRSKNKTPTQLHPQTFHDMYHMFKTWVNFG